MLFERYMELKAESAKDDIDEFFDTGVIRKEKIKNRINLLKKAPAYLEIAEWFEEVHDDDLTKSEYIIEDETTDQPDCPDELKTHFFIGELVLDEYPDKDIHVTVRKNDDRTKKWLEVQEE